MRNNRWINFVPYLIVILALFSLMNMNTGTATESDLQRVSKVS